LPVLVVAALIGLSWQTASAEEDLVHIVKGMVVETADGTEHTIKWTGNTTVAGGKDGDAVAVNSKVSVKYTEKAGEKTALASRTSVKRRPKPCNESTVTLFRFITEFASHC
jgi:hypothetical protein